MRQAHEEAGVSEKILTDEEVLAMWRSGELVVRTGRIHHGNLCVCPEKGNGEWCDKCQGYALEQGQ